MGKEEVKRGNDGGYLNSIMLFVGKKTFLLLPFSVYSPSTYREEIHFTLTKA